MNIEDQLKELDEQAKELESQLKDVHTERKRLRDQLAMSYGLESGETVEVLWSAQPFTDKKWVKAEIGRIPYTVSANGIMYHVYRIVNGRRLKKSTQVRSTHIRRTTAVKKTKVRYIAHRFSAGWRIQDETRPSIVSTTTFPTEIEALQAAARMNEVR
jgi:hypothetical protein